MALQLDKQTVNQAFESARASCGITEGRLVLVTEEHYDAAVAFARDVFTPDETISNALQVQWSVELETSWRHVLKDNLSLMLIDDASGDVIAFRTICICNTDEPVEPENSEDPAARKLEHFLNFCYAQSNVAEVFGVKYWIRFFALCVKPTHRKRGIGAKIFNAAIKMVGKFGLDSVWISGEGSSEASQKIYERAGFRILFEIAHKDYKVEGEQVIPDTGETEKIYARHVQAQTC